MEYRNATEADLQLLAKFNHQLIRDEGHRNRMTVSELEDRMRNWLRNEYRAVIFGGDGDPVAYALYRQDPDSIYLRQFFVASQHRGQGIGRQAMNILRSQIWPHGWRIRVDVLVNNHAGYAFWKAVGFQDYAITLELPTDEVRE